MGKASTLRAACAARGSADDRQIAHLHADADSTLRFAAPGQGGLLPAGQRRGARRASAALPRCPARTRREQRAENRRKRRIEAEHVDSGVDAMQRQL